MNLDKFLSHGCKFEITKNVYFGQRSDILARFQFADEVSHEFELHSSLHFFQAFLTTNQDYHFIAMISLASKKKKKKN